MKKFLFLLILPIIFLIPKDTHAMGIRILGQNFKTIAECNNCSELTSKGEDLYEGVYQIYLTFDNLQFRSGSTYSVETTFFLNSLVDGIQFSSPNFWIGYGGINIEQTVNQEYYKINYQNQVSDPYFAAPVFKKNISFKGSFKSKTTGTGAIIELPFKSPITIRGIVVDTYGIVNTGSDEGDIINNSTNLIINNNNQNTDKIVQGQEDIKDAITSEEAPDLDSLQDSAGWLKPGPVDSILNLPLSLFQNLTDNLSKSCQPVIATLPYVDKTITLPCVSTLYEQIGVQDFLNWVGIVVGALILYNYFLKLYQWVDDVLTFRENNWQDWGGV